MRHLRTLCLLVLLFAVSQPSSGWCFAHKVVAHIAMQYLTPATKEKLDYYLDASLVEYSLWMDRCRPQEKYLYTHPWHMGTSDENWEPASSLDEVRGTTGGRIEPGIEHVYGVLKNWKELDDSTVFDNIKLITHMLGDLHCPAHRYYYDLPTYKGHSGYDSKYGWFPLKYNGQSTTYHAVWDLALDRAHPEFGLKVGLYTAHIDSGISAELRQEIMSGTVRDWAIEENKVCRQVYTWAKPGDEIDVSWYRSHVDFIDRQVLKAGYRLAKILNTVFDENYR